MEQQKLGLISCFDASLIGPAQIVVQTDDPAVISLRKSVGHDLVMYSVSIRADEQSLITIRYWLGNQSIPFALT